MNARRVLDLLDHAAYSVLATTAVLVTTSSTFELLWWFM